MTNADDIALSAVENALSKPPKGEGEIVCAPYRVGEVCGHFEIIGPGYDDPRMYVYRKDADRFAAQLNAAYRAGSHSRSPDTLTQERDALREACEWVVKDAYFKAPEERYRPEIVERWLDRLESALTQSQRGEGGHG